jgi:putative ABC transport system permease protein
VVTNLRYDLRLVAKSLRRDLRFTVVMVVSQALSVSLFTTSLVTARRYSSMTGQLAPHVYRAESKSNAQLAHFFDGTPFEGFGQWAGIFIGLPTTRALQERTAPALQAKSFVSVLAGGPAGEPPARLPVRFCDADLFDIFLVDFSHGHPWRRQDEAARAPVAVISDLLNRRLFDGGNSVGRTIRAAGREFRIVGVLGQPPGQVHLLDVGVPPENLGYLMVPFGFADELRPVPWIAWPPLVDEQGWSAISASKSGFIDYWLQLPTAEARAQFATALRAFPDIVLRSGEEVVAQHGQAPGPYRVFVILTLVLMEASVVNVMRMLLAKATARAAEIGIHRALGAGKRVILVRQLYEGTLVSLTGSLLGLVLAAPTVRVFDLLVPDSPIKLGFTPQILAAALLVCLLAGLVTALYPAWRVASVPPTRSLGKI